MKNVKYFLLFILSLSLNIIATGQALHNAIDDLKSDRDVEKFIHKHGVDKEFRVLSLKKIAQQEGLSDSGFVLFNKTVDSLNLKIWQKVDFENNGHTGLLVYAYPLGARDDEAPILYAFMDSCNRIGTKELTAVEGTLGFVSLTKVVKIGNVAVVIIYQNNSHWMDKMDKWKIVCKDSMITKFGVFIKYSSCCLQCKPHEIEKIEYTIPVPPNSVGGDYPRFSVSITSDRKAVFYNWDG